jgi:hypothetical protein
VTSQELSVKAKEALERSKPSASPHPQVRGLAKVLAGLKRTWYVDKRQHGGCCMFYYFSPPVRECLAQAQMCAERAKTQSSPQLKQLFLKNEQHWVSLARRRYFAEGPDMPPQNGRTRQMLRGTRKDQSKH